MQTHVKQKTLNKMLIGFHDRCRQAGLKVTPQRMAIYKALVQTDTHPTADEVYQSVRTEMPTISLDTVNRTLLTLAEVGAAFVVEGSGQPRRYDGGMHDHQHFRCIKCGKIVDFHYEPYDNIGTPEHFEDVKIVRKTVYLEGYCGPCNQTEKTNSKLL